MQGRATLALTTLAMIAFAANSILCRMALADPLIDPASFTAVRVASGAVALALIVAFRAEGGIGRVFAAGGWRAGAALFAYAIAFSLAYVSLGAAAGALILFGAVQITMIAVGLARGERLSWMQTAGASVAVAGLVYLLSPGLSAPPLFAALLMASAGVAWGVYSLIGRGARQRGDPTLVTAGNFLRTAPMALVPLALVPMALSAPGAALAIASGALSSGVGYAIWYAALKGLGASEAAIVQLTVPVIAAAGAIVFLDETLTLRFALAAAAILGGVAIVLTAKRKPA